MSSANLADTGMCVEAKGLTKVFGGGDVQVRAVADLDVQIPPGQFAAIMGPSGSGKSTLLHCLAGLDRPTSGEVFIRGSALSRLSDDELTRLRRDRVGFVFQSFNLLPALTALENILLPSAIAGRHPDRDWLDTVIQTTGLADRLRHLPAQLSGGQQQRVACARALVTRPDVVFADEPTGNLDTTSSAEVLGLLSRSAKEHGQTIVMVTHDPSAASICDRVVFLVDGRVVGELDQPSREAVLSRMAGLEPERVS